MATLKMLTDRSHEAGNSAKPHAPQVSSVIKTRRGSSDLLAWVFLLPGLLIFGAAIVAPMVYAGWISLFNWDGLSEAKLVGMANYVDTVREPTVRRAAWHSGVLVVFYTVFPICIGLLFAAIISGDKRLRFASFWRTVLFVPQILSIVVVGVAWQWLLQIDGPINQGLHAIGLGQFARAWLGDLSFALPAQGVIGTWMMTGLCVVLLLAGAQTIDLELYDAASVDGASPLQQFWHVTVPSLRNVIVVCSVLTFAVSLNNFGLIWVTTRGGPGDATQVLSTEIYSRAFVLSELGMASALAVVVFVVAMLATVLVSRRSEDA